MQLIFSQLARYGILHTFTGIRKLSGIVIYQPIQRILPAGNDLLHSTVLGQYGPLRLQIHLKITHLAITLHIDLIDLLGNLNELTVDP